MCIPLCTPVVHNTAWCSSDNTLPLPPDNHQSTTAQMLFIRAEGEKVQLTGLVGVGLEFNTPLDTIQVILEAVFTANHLTDTDKQNSTGKYTRYKSESKQPKIQQNKTTLVQLPLTTLGQETRWAYSTTLPSPHWLGLTGHVKIKHVLKIHFCWRNILAFWFSMFKTVVTMIKKYKRNNMHKGHLTGQYEHKLNIISPNKRPKFS